MGTTMQKLPTRAVLVETGRMGASPTLRQALERVRSWGIPTEVVWERCEVPEVKITSYPSLVLERVDKKPQVITGGNIGLVIELLGAIVAGDYEKKLEPAMSA